MIFCDFLYCDFLTYDEGEALQGSNRHLGFTKWISRGNNCKIMKSILWVKVIQMLRIAKIWFFWFTSKSGKTRMPSEGNIWKQSDKQHHLWQQRSSELSTKLHIDRCYDNMQICVWNLVYRLWRYGDRCSSCSGCSSRPWISM